MKSSWHELWGCARGPVRHLSPQGRLLCGIICFALCMVAPVRGLPGTGLVSAVLLLWLGLCRLPSRVLLASLSLGLLLFLPYFLLAPIIRMESPSKGWVEALQVPWTVFFRGLSAMLVSVSTVASLSASELRQGLMRLPVPKAVSAILIQIVHQVSTLVYESRRVAAAISVRGGSSGFKTGMRVITSLPKVWLPRVIHRAERVADAMEVRGYCQEGLESLGTANYSRLDLCAMGLFSLVLAGAVCLRFWGAS